MFNRKSIASLIAVLTALGVLGVSATSAWATTTVTPAGAEASVRAATNQVFTTNNGNGVSVTCEEVEAEFTVPAATNNSSAGSVWTDFTLQPTYNACTTEGAPTKVTTNTTNGNWSFDAMDFPDVEAGNNDEAAGDVVAIGVPKAGAVINVAEGACVITVSPNEASAIIGAWKDGEGGANSTASITEQVNFAAAGPACPAGIAPPAVYTGSVEVETAAGGTVNF